MAASATEDRFRARAGTRMLLSIAAGFDYEGLRELVARGIPGLPPPPPDGLPDLDELDRIQAEKLDEEEGLDEEEDDELEDEALEPADADSKYRISPKGEELVRTLSALRRWIDDRPGGPPDPDAQVAEAIGPLICGWSGTLIHALAPGPVARAELERAAPGLDGEDLRAQMETMVRSGLAEARSEGGETLYTLTEWGQEAIAPIVAAVNYELHDDDEHTLPPDVLDVDAAFQMALPLLRLPPWLRGSCRLGVRIPGGEPLMAGAAVIVDSGVVGSSSPLLDEQPETWVTGDPRGWCETVIDPAAGKLLSGGDTELADALVDALHERLFGGDGG